MEDSDNSIDNEELEARLYEQIYYSNHQTEDDMNCNFNSPTSSDGSKSTTGNTEVPDQTTQKTPSKRKDSEPNENDKIAGKDTASETPAKKKRTDDKIPDPESSPKVNNKQLRKELKKKLREKKKVAKEKKSREEQKQKVLKKRKEIREKASNPLKPTKVYSAKGVAAIFQEHESDEDDEDCLIVEDEPEPSKKTKKRSSEPEKDEGKYSTETKSQKSSKVQEEEESDSDESICEVPVPPKPPPVIVDLDSDAGQDEDEESSEEEGANTMAVKSVEHYQVIDEIETDDSEESDDLEVTLDSKDVEDENADMILNCTPVKKGVASLDEIKRLRKNAEDEENIQSNADTNSDQNVDKNQEETCSNIVETVEGEPHRVQTRSQSKKSSKETNSSKENYFPPMTKKMQDFYNNSWGGENFELDQIQSEMSTDPRKWAILDEDMRPKNAANRYYEVCKSCNKPGHSRRKCPTEKRRLNLKICHMCGVTGHLEIRCPRRMCLTCGRKQNTYRKTCENCRKLRCTTCKSVGHAVEHCPDNWRRFHNITTEEAWASAQAPANAMKPKREQHCCNCTQKGHDSSSCTRYRWSQHFPTPSFVSNYSSYGNLPEPELLRNPFANNRTPPENQPTAVEISLNQVPAEPRSLEKDQLEESCIPDHSSMLAPLIMTQPSTDPRIVTKLFEKPKQTKHYAYQIKNKGDEWLSSLRAGGCDATFLQRLRFYTIFSFEVEMMKDQQVMLHINCRPTTNVEYLRNLINAWMNRTDEERKNMIMICIQPKKSLDYFIKQIQKFCATSREPDVVYNDLKKLKELADKNSDPESVKKYEDVQVELNQSLIKYGVSKKTYMITQLFAKHWKTFNTSKTSVKMFNFIPLLHYTNILFSVYTPSGIEDKITSYIDRKKSGELGKEYHFFKLFGGDGKYIKETCNVKIGKPTQKQPKVTKQVPDASPGPSNPQPPVWDQNSPAWNQDPRWEPPNVPRNISQNQAPATNKANVIQFIQNIVERPMPDSRFGPNCPGSPWMMNNQNFLPNPPMGLLGHAPNRSGFGPENFYEDPQEFQPNLANFHVNNVNNGFMINSPSNNYMMNTSNNNFIMNSPMNQPNKADLHQPDLHQRAFNLILQLTQLNQPQLNRHVRWLHKRIGKQKLTENDVTMVSSILKKTVQRSAMKALSKSKKYR